MVIGGDVIMNEDEIKVYTVNDCRSYGLAKRNLEELTKKISSIQLDLELDDDEAPKLEKSLIALRKKQDEQRNIISSFTNSQVNYDSGYLSSNLDYLLKKSSLRISDLEELLGVSAGYVSRTINPESKKRLSVDIVWKISDIFKVNIDDLLNMDYQAPTQSLSEVIAFFEKLKQETDAAIIHWKNRGSRMENHQGMFFSLVEAAELSGGKSFRYAPMGYEDTTRAIALTDSIFSVDTHIGTVYLLPLEDLFGENGYEIYIYIDNEDFEPDIFELICATFDDRSGTLKVKCDELFNSIKLHESDFVVSDSAKNLINRYLRSNEDFMNISDGLDEELPFDIPDGLDEELPFD